MESENEMNKSDMLNSVNTMGFNLEFEVYKKINEMKSGSDLAFKFTNIELGKQYETEDKIYNLDVFAKSKLTDNNFSGGMFYIECKGSAGDSKLFLIDSPKSVYDRDARLRMGIITDGNDTGKLRIVSNELCTGYNYKDPNLFFTINGDFFESSQSSESALLPFKVTNKNRNNLYKGIQQLTDLLIHLENKRFNNEVPTGKDSDGKELKQALVFPIIVVKSDICVIRYGEDESFDRVWTTVPWVAYKSDLRREMVMVDADSSPPCGETVVYFSIVNVNYLESYVKQIYSGFIYPENHVCEELK